MKHSAVAALALAAVSLMSMTALAQTPAPSASAPAVAAQATQRLRGTLQSFDGSTLVMTERDGEVLRLALADNFSVSEVLPIALTAIQPGSFVGAAALPSADGHLLALEVLVFPESARGSGEGHYPWDLQPGSTMTNATVADVVTQAQGQTLTLRYKDGEKTLNVPPSVPVVTFKPADRSLLVPGAKLLVTAQLRNGVPTALRALAGRDGFTPPM